MINLKIFDRKFDIGLVGYRPGPKPLLYLKPIFHWILGPCLLPNANEIDTNNMKSTWPTQKNCIGDPTLPIFHLLTLGVGIGGNASFSAFRYQHVGIPNAKLWRWGCEPSPGPNANGFALHWDIGFNFFFKKPCDHKNGEHQKELKIHLQSDRHCFGTALCDVIGHGFSKT